ncbi:MAG: cupin domain-containing protein, partial [Bryobacteraceae bacterium]
MEGVLTWTVDGTPVEVGPGQALCIPRGAVHRFDNLGGEDVKQLAVISPAILGPAYFREAAQVIASAQQTGSPPHVPRDDIRHPRRPTHRSHQGTLPFRTFVRTSWRVPVARP